VIKLLSMLCALLLAGAARAASPAVSYDIRPILEGGGLTALAVELRFDGDASGRTRLELPGGGDHGDGAKPDIADVQVSGATVETVAGDSEVLRHAPGAPIVVRYHIVSGYDGLSRGQPWRAVIFNTWFAVHGERAFIRPAERDEAPMTVKWLGVPKGWLIATNFAAGEQARVGDIDERYLIGGAGWSELSRPIGPASLHLYFRSERPASAPVADMLAAVAKAEFAYWGDRPSDVFAPVIPVEDDSGGRGVLHGFLVILGKGGDLLSYKRVFAHEQQHDWISQQIGGFPATQADLEAWLNEGFTEANAARVLLRAQLWTLQDFADDLNGALLRYGTSPVRDAPNSRIQQQRNSNFDVSNLPYDRGRLLAVLWDRRLRAATDGRVGLQDVLQTQRRLARAAKAGGRRTSADRLFPIAVRQAAGLDLAPDIARYVDQGATIVLPADLFGGCGRIETVSQPLFDRGFDFWATARNGWRVTGLEAGGPAERAGLRDGQVIRVDEIPSHDSQTPLTYRVVGFLKRAEHEDYYDRDTNFTPFSLKA